MERLYEDVTRKHEALFERLRQEFRKSARSRPNSP
jgi:hypothetical protein